MRAYNPKVVGGKFIIFSVMNKQKDGTTAWLQVMVNQDQSTFGLQHKEEIKILKISGADTNEYKGKLQFTLFAEIERLQFGVQPTDELSETETQVLLGISNSDLPF